MPGYLPPHLASDTGPAREFASVLPLLLAGGRGSRLHELTAAECKPALPLMLQSGQTIRMVDFTVANAARSGLRQMMVATEYRPATLRKHLAHRWGTSFPGGLHLRDGADLTAGGYAGTGHAVAANRSEIDRLAPDDLLILSGDHVYEMDYGPLIRAHRSSGAAITVAVTHVPLSRARAFGVVEADAVAGEASPIRAFVEKPNRPQPSADHPDLSLVSMGVYVANWRWLRSHLSAELAQSGGEIDFGHDILPAAVRGGQAQCWVMPALPHHDTAYWRDVGTLDALRETVLDLMATPAPCAPPVPAGLTAMAQASDGGFDALQYGFACAPGAGLMLRAPRLGARAGDRWTLLEECAILPGARLSPGVRLTRALVAPGTTVPAGLVVGEDPDEDARWFRRTEQGTVLVTSSMLVRRAAERRRLVPVAPMPLSARVMAAAGGGLPG